MGFKRNRALKTNIRKLKCRASLGPLETAEKQTVGGGGWVRGSSWAQ